MGSCAALAELESVWILSDEVFYTHITEARALFRPISLRNPFIFYLGHLPSFAWNTIRASLTPSPEPIHRVWDDLFSRGIDPDVEDPTLCHDHPPPPPEWPAWTAVVDYSNRTREAVREAVAGPNPPSPRILRLVAEHEAMHVETLYYMIAQSMRTSARCCTASEENAGGLEDGIPMDDHHRPHLDWLVVEPATVVLGTSNESSFTWDNEAIGDKVAVEKFRISKYAISISDFATFVRMGGYRHRSLWTADDWAWVQREGLGHPSSWVCNTDGSFTVLTGAGPGSTRLKLRSLDEANSWPVSVSLAEARAYAAWVGASVPSEAQWLLAMYGPTGGSAHVDTVDVMKGMPCSVVEGNSGYCGAVGMVGNGWEITSSLFDSFDGFRPTPEYPEYSQDFFDGKHFVLKGASWASHSSLVRPSFRNFYQARYPYVFSKFRLVGAIPDEA